MCWTCAVSTFVLTAFRDNQIEKHVIRKKAEQLCDDVDEEGKLIIITLHCEVILFS